MRSELDLNGPDFWEEWYAMGFGSGMGSRGLISDWKANFVNHFIRLYQIESIVDFGCGDGYQAGKIHVPSYVGYDVSPTALATCRKRFKDDPTKTFSDMPEGHSADVALSMDVAYHLLDDDEYNAHIRDLFASAERYVLLYQTVDGSADTKGHIMHRAPPADYEWMERSKHDPHCAFYVYRM